MGYSKRVLSTDILRAYYFSKKLAGSWRAPLEVNNYGYKQVQASHDQQNNGVKHPKLYKNYIQIVTLL